MHYQFALPVLGQYIVYLYAPIFAQHWSNIGETSSQYLIQHGFNIKPVSDQYSADLHCQYWTDTVYLYKTNRKANICPTLHQHWHDIAPISDPAWIQHQSRYQTNTMPICVFAIGPISATYKKPIFARHCTNTGMTLHQYLTQHGSNIKADIRPIQCQFALLL